MCLALTTKIVKGLMLVMRSVRVAHNGLALGEEADFIIIFICDQDLKFLE